MDCFLSNAFVGFIIAQRGPFVKACTATMAGYLKTYIDLVKNRYSMSLKIESTDFFRFVWENSGLAD